MILVTGANGHLGRAIIHALLEKGVRPETIAGLVREKANAQDLQATGIELRVGDYDWYPTLVRAFQGVEQLIFVSGTDLSIRLEQHESVITAVKEVGVKQLVYTSFFDEHHVQDSPFGFVSSSVTATDVLIKESGIPYTLLKDNLYLELLPMLLGKQVLQAGIYLPAGAGKAAFVTQADIADAVATVVTQAGHLNKEYTISNTENVSFAQIASLLSEQTGTSIPYTSPSRTDYVATMVKSGLSNQLVSLISGLAEAIGVGEFYSSSTDLERLLGRKPVSAKLFLQRAYQNTTSIL
ncbi:NmrA family NAD(P)-binding protein [Spirosoma endophyticum]|uniref:NAD(P)H dehydrogenase (Quinone) n=1 Tax=Spirosoma endophyticum TaxID=662367 RepID=A0A1I2DW69_9BACT|nr:NmrA family NAD(P)-binding protein [Spirosoma endophyticum]SFE84483.1 NAD(P)H dehydrogenase (quinone) [Spirosoma endophyticum]